VPVTYRASSEASHSNGIADVLGLDVGNLHRLLHREHEFRVLAGGTFEVGPEHPVHRIAVQHCGGDVGRMDDVGPDAPGSEFCRQVVYVGG